MIRTDQRAERMGNGVPSLDFDRQKFIGGPDEEIKRNFKLFITKFGLFLRFSSQNSGFDRPKNRKQNAKRNILQTFRKHSLYLIGSPAEQFSRILKGESKKKFEIRFMAVKLSVRKQHKYIRNKKAIMYR